MRIETKHIETGTGLEGEQWIGGQQRIGIQSGDSEASSLSAGLQQRTTGKHFGARIFPQGAPLYRLANGEEARGWKHSVRRTHHNGGGREFGNECRDAARRHGAGVAGLDAHRRGIHATVSRVRGDGAHKAGGRGDRGTERKGRGSGGGREGATGTELERGETGVAIATVAQSAKSTQARSGVLTGKGKGQAASIAEKIPKGALQWHDTCRGS